MNELFSSNLDKTAMDILNNFDQIIQGVKPLNSRQLQQLPDNIRSLSHQLTDQRSTRRLGYMNDNIQLSSYVRYYTWWNLVRLTRLFSNLPAASFPELSKDSVCLDLGSGPLTVVTAMWLARPELRKEKLTWYCLDVSGNGLSLGEDIYLSVVARTGGDAWKIIRVKGSFGTTIKQKADFVSCANMFNELDQASDMPPEFQTKKYFEQIRKYSSPYAKVLLIEPGVPKAARTIALLRDRFIKEECSIIAPCPHAQECPMNGFKAYTGSSHKWCNFAFATDDAPSKLLKLSTLAKLPKERATLCFVSVNGAQVNASENKGDAAGSGKAGGSGNSTGSGTKRKDRENVEPLLCRITSDSFKLPRGRAGVYACSKLGLTLLSYSAQAFTEGKLPKSGSLLEVKIKTPNLPVDEKSGAFIIQM